MDQVVTINIKNSTRTKLKNFVSGTDNDWFKFLAGQAGIDEVNFSQPDEINHLRGQNGLRDVVEYVNYFLEIEDKGGASTIKLYMHAGGQM